MLNWRLKAFITVVLVTSSVCAFQMTVEAGCEEYPNGEWCVEGAPPAPPPPPLPPGPCCECGQCTGSPVYVATGNYSFEATDLTLPTRGFPLVIGRYYDSVRGVDGFFGIGWTSNLLTRLYYSQYTSSTSEDVEEAVVAFTDGKTYRFRRINGTGNFIPPPGSRHRLIQDLNGEFVLLFENNLSRYHFGTDGKLLEIIDDYGNSLAVTYDANGRVDRISDGTGSGRYLQLTYTPAGRVGWVTDTSGRTITYSYDNAALSSVRDALSNSSYPNGRTTKYEYEVGRAGSRLMRSIKMVMPDGSDQVLTSISYGTDNRVSSFSEAGETYTYQYDLVDDTDSPIHYTLRTDTSGNRRMFYYNSFGQAVERHTPDDGLESTVFDSNGLVDMKTDAEGIKTKFFYDNGIITSMIRDYQGAEAVQTDYSYDTSIVAYDGTAHARLSGITARVPGGGVNRDWQSWQYEYYHSGETGGPIGALKSVYRVRRNTPLDVDGNLLRCSVSICDLLSIYTYNSAGRILTVADAAGKVTTYEYDSVTGDLARIKYPKNSDTGDNPTYIYDHDILGRIRSITDPSGNVTSYTYDAADRTITETLPLPYEGSPSFTTTYTYDLFDSASGLTYTEERDFNNRLTRSGYDSLGRLIRSVDLAGTALTFEYTKGKLTKITDQNNNETSYSYSSDQAHRVATTAFPDGLEERYTYYRDGLLNTLTDRNGRTYTFVYDGLKRQRQKEYPTGTTVYTYSGEMLTAVFDGIASDTISYIFDDSYRVQSEQQADRGTLSYTYDATDRIRTGHIGNGPTATYDYYDNGDVKSIEWTPVPGQFVFTYTPTNDYNTILFPDGQTRHYAYDNLRRMTEISNAHPSVGNLATYAYAYDVDNSTGERTMLGLETALTSSVPSQGLSDSVSKYYYEDRYQLAKVEYPPVPPFNGEVHEWSYDSIGNRVTSTFNGVPQAYTYYTNGANPLNSQRLQRALYTYVYDGNGNVISRQATPSGPTFVASWDYENRMTSYGDGLAPLSASYDYQGRRTRKTVAGQGATYLYDGQNLVGDMSSGTYFLLGPGTDQPLAMYSMGNVYYYCVDGLGSATLLNDENGGVQASYVYDAWGGLKAQTSEVPNPFTFTSREGPEADVMYYRARYYSPSVGRFIGEDTLRGYYNELYLYAYNSPLLFTDPSGHHSAWVPALKPKPHPPGTIMCRRRKTFPGWEDVYIVRDKDTICTWGEPVGTRAREAWEKAHGNCTTASCTVKKGSANDPYKDLRYERESPVDAKILSFWYCLSKFQKTGPGGTAPCWSPDSGHCPSQCYDFVQSMISCRLDCSTRDSLDDFCPSWLK